MVITESGCLLVTAGDLQGEDGIAALGIGSYHALSRLMALLGLGTGRTVFQQADEGGVLMSSLSAGAIIVIVLDKDGAAGLARFVLKRETVSLNRLLEEASVE